MLKVMVVDDEPLLRMAIKNLFDWDKNGLQIITDAPNGEIAIDIIKNERPDIVITDIKMPKMNGIELIKHIKSNYPEIQTIVLSSYDDFEYVREALTHGSVDYILKSNLVPEAFINIINKIKNKCMAERNIGIDFSDDKNHISKNFQKMRNEFLKNLIQGKIKTEELIEEQNLFYQLNIRKGKYSVCYFQFDNMEDISDKYNDSDTDLIQNTIVNIIEELFCFNGVYFHKEFYQYIAIVYMDVPSEKEFIEKTIKFAKGVQNAVLRYANITVTAGISQITGRLGQIHDAYMQSKQAVEYKFHHGSGKVYLYGDFDLKEEDLTKKWMSLKNMKLFKEFIETESWVQIEDYIQTILKECHKEHYLGSCVKKLICDLLLLLQNNIIDKVDDDWNMLLQNEELCSHILHLDTIEDIGKFVSGYIGKINGCVNKLKNARYSDIVCKVLNYIQINYNKKITLLTISDYINVNPSYLSRLFLQETGRNFIDYLTDIRVEKAKKYLSDGNLAIQEVAERVGYQNARYLNRVFKRLLGVSPYNFKYHK